MEERLNRRNWAGLSPCRKSAGFTIDTNAEPHNLSTFCDPGPAKISVGTGLHEKGDVNGRAPQHWSSDKVFPWLIVGSSASHNGSV
jgi:hypothetical protein